MRWGTSTLPRPNSTCCIISTINLHLRSCYIPTVGLVAGLDGGRQRECTWQLQGLRQENAQVSFFSSNSKISAGILQVCSYSGMGLGPLWHNLPGKKLGKGSGFLWKLRSWFIFLMAGDFEGRLERDPELPWSRLGSSLPRRDKIHPREVSGRKRVLRVTQPASVEALPGPEKQRLEFHSGKSGVQVDSLGVRCHLILRGWPTTHPHLCFVGQVCQGPHVHQKIQARRYSQRWGEFSSLATAPIHHKGWSIRKGQEHRKFWWGRRLSFLSTCRTTPKTLQPARDTVRELVSVVPSLLIPPLLWTLGDCHHRCGLCSRHSWHQVLFGAYTGLEESRMQRLFSKCILPRWLMAQAMERSSIASPLPGIY